MIELNSIYRENCLETMARMPNDFIDLTVTSPPYDNLRKYNGYDFDFESIAKELFRVTKVGGVVVWVVTDATINGSETGTSFKQALFFKECGFNLHDTMIYYNSGTGAKGSNNAYWQAFEYMFILSKNTPKSINRIKDKKNITKGSIKKANPKNEKIGSRTFGNRIVITEEFGYRENVWSINAGHNDMTDHPAPFPEQLAADHIYTWSNEGDLIYDPFTGSGTTLKMAHLQKRKWIGSEISSEYVQLANKRIAPYLTIQTIF